MKIEISNGSICLPLESIVSSMNMEQKREVLAWLATDDEVIRSVVSHICGDDEQGWSMGDPDRREEILRKVEGEQLSGPRLSWKPWQEARRALKDIRSSEHLYWTLYHKIDPEVSRLVMSELRRLGVESNYTTEQANDDIARVESVINQSFAAMRKGATP